MDRMVLTFDIIFRRWVGFPLRTGTFIGKPFCSGDSSSVGVVPGAQRSIPVRIGAMLRSAAHHDFRLFYRNIGSVLEFRVLAAVGSPL